MFTQKQTQVIGILAILLIGVWSIIIVLVGLEIYKSRTPAVVVVVAQVNSIATPGPVVAPQETARPKSAFPPTWTPTATPPSTATPTLVPTASPWPTKTPTLTFTPSPTREPTPLPHLSAFQKEAAIAKYRPIFEEVAAEYDLNWRLMAEQAYMESRFNPHAIGSKNDLGMMQIMPATWGYISKNVDVDDPFDPHDNILAAGFFLSELRASCQRWGDPSEGCMILGYSWGPGNTSRLYAQGKTWRQAPYYRYRYVATVIQGAYQK